MQPNHSGTMTLNMYSFKRVSKVCQNEQADFAFLPYSKQMK